MPQLHDLKSDRKAETEGEWIDCPELGFDEETGEPVALRVRSVHYPAYKTELQTTRLRLLRQHPGDQIVPPDVEDRENGRLFAKHLLVDWRHIEPAYSPEIALQALTDVEQRALRDAVVSAARVVGARRVAQAKAIEGNSPPASVGS